MKETINCLQTAIKQIWPSAKLLPRYQYSLSEPASYWFLLEPESIDLIRIFPNRYGGSFYLSCFRCPDKDTVDKFAIDLERSGNDMLMLPYSTQNLDVSINGMDFLIRQVGMVSKHDTLLNASTSQLISYAANGFC